MDYISIVQNVKSLLLSALIVIYEFQCDGREGSKQQYKQDQAEPAASDICPGVFIVLFLRCRFRLLFHIMADILFPQDIDYVSHRRVDFDGLIPQLSGSGIGIDELLRAVEENLPVKLRSYKLMLPFDKAPLIAVLRGAGALRTEEYTADGILVTAIVEEPLWHLIDEYSV